MLGAATLTMLLMPTVLELNGVEAEVAIMIIVVDYTVGAAVILRSDTRQTVRAHML